MSSFSNSHLQWNEKQVDTLGRFPKRANFRTIRRLYGAKDRAHLARFKIERFLKEPYEDPRMEDFSASSRDSEGSPEIFADMDMGGLIQGNRPLSDESSRKMTSFASSLGIIDWNPKDNYRESGIHLAAGWDHEAMVRLLLEAGG
jgi:hypothetical protein